MLLLYKFLAKQFRKPSGLLAGWVSRKMETLNQEVYDWVLSLLVLSPSDHVLEVGYGPGVGIRQIARIVENGPGSVSGVDASAAMYKKASRRNRVAIEKGDVCLMLGCADKTCLPSDRFDAVIGINVVYFFDDAAACLRELHRVVRPGGRAAFYLTDSAYMTHLPEVHFNKYSGEAFVTLMKRAGFEDVSVASREISSGGRSRLGHCVVGRKVVAVGGRPFSSPVKG